MTPTEEKNKMYFHLMCRIPCFHRLSECMNSDGLTHHLAAQNLRVTDSRSLYVIEPKTLVAQLYEEAMLKTLQTENAFPKRVCFHVVSGSKKDVVSICAITQVNGKDGFLLFSSDFKNIEFFAKSEFPLTVW